MLVSAAIRLVEILHNFYESVSRKKEEMGKLRSYMIALRPWSFSASLTPVFLGNALAYNYLAYTKSHQFNQFVFMLSLIITLFVHGAGNLGRKRRLLNLNIYDMIYIHQVNTYYDFKRGIDTENTTSDRTLVDKLLTPQDITRLCVLLYLFGSIAFFILLFLSPAQEEILAFIYFGGLSLSFMYTGGVGFKYMALGDLIILLTFGPIAVLFSYLSQVGTYAGPDSYYLSQFLKPLVYAVPLALNTEAILHSNNTRDLESDKKSGIVTVAMYLGRTGSYILFVLLIFVPYLVFLLMSIQISWYYMLPWTTIRLAFDLERQFRTSRLADLPIKTAKLNLVFGLLYVLAVLLSGR